MIKNILLGTFLVLVTTGYAAARPEVTKKTQCVEVGSDKKSKEYPCLATETGGAGISVLIYSFNKKEYHIVESYDLAKDAEIFDMNNLPVVGYMRDKSFKKTDDERKKAYYCYVTKKEHICSVQ